MGQGFLTGVREDRCCGRGCAFMCVSYTAEDRVWRLSETADSTINRGFHVTSKKSSSKSKVMKVMGEYLCMKRK